MAALHPARMQDLAEVSRAVRQHTDIDHGSSQRLKAAAANKLSAFSRSVPQSSRAETNRQRLRKEIGGTIAAFYKKAQH